MPEIEPTQLHALHWGERLTLNAIAERLELDIEAVRRRFADARIPRRSDGTTRAEVNTDELRHLYWDKGWNYQNLADRFGVNQATVGKWFVQHDIPRLPPSASRRFRSHHPGLKVLTEWWGEGIGIDAIAGQCNIERLAVWQWLRAAGLTSSAPPTDILADLHTEWHWTLPEIAAQYGLEADALGRTLTQHGTPLRDDEAIFATRDPCSDVGALERMYTVEHVSLGGVARHFNVSINHVKAWIERYGLERGARPPTPRPRVKRKRGAPTAEELERLYWKEAYGVAELATRFDTSREEVNRWFEAHGIEQRTSRRPISPPTKEEFEAVYHDFKRTMREVAGHFGVSRQTLMNWRVQLGVALRSRVKLSREVTVEPTVSAEELERLHRVEGISINALARKFEVRPTEMVRWFKALGVERLSAGDYVLVRSRYPGEDVLRELHVVQGHTQDYIAGHFEVSRATVSRWMMRAGITAKHSKRRRRPPREELEAHYYNDDKTQAEIAGIYGVSVGTVHTWFKKHGITRDSKREALKGSSG